MVGDTYTQVVSGLNAGQSVVLADYAEAVPSSNNNTNLGSVLGGGGAGGFFGGAGASPAAVAHSGSRTLVVVVEGARRAAERLRGPHCPNPLRRAVRVIPELTIGLGSVAQPVSPSVNDPAQLFVNKAAIESDRHGELTWGAAHAGVAAGVIEAVAEGVVAAADATELLLIAAVWVNPQAGDEQAVFENNKAATLGALRAGKEGRPVRRRGPVGPTHALQRLLLRILSGTVGPCPRSASIR